MPVDKPVGLTSYDVIRRIKQLLPRGQKIGHAGTLDPFASGVLLLLLGAATKRFDEIQKWRKTYLATARLGYYSETLDATGEIKQCQSKQVTREQIEAVLPQFAQEIEQEIPRYSAAKVGGKPRYKYAREGKTLPPKSKKVMIYEIELLPGRIKDNDSLVHLRVRCGSGTYIRQLSYDIFKTLGVESYLQDLRRERVGEIDIKDCASLADLSTGEDFKRFLIQKT